MKTAEKIVQLRKKNNLSQEDLADSIGVSRQAISRWESGGAYPDATNIIQLSRLFGVTTDYILKDEYLSDADIPLVQAANEQKEEANLKNSEHLKISLLFYFIAILGSVFATVLSESGLQLAFSTLSLSLFTVIFIITLKNLFSDNHKN